MPQTSAPARDQVPLPKALTGLRVLDLSRVLAGPLCAQILADMGAEVIKIERPNVGDDTRHWEPSFVSDKEGVERHSSYFWSVNRGKESVTINLATEEGAKLIRQLVSISDILIENYKVDDLARYGLSYADLSVINPRLVYCSITGFGQTGPYRSRSGYDTIIQAMGGLMSITGEKDGRPGGGPQRCGVPVIDMMTGVYSALAILAAIRFRDLSNLGQHIDMSLLDVQVATLAYFGVDYLATDRVQKRTGNSNPVSHPSGAYTCADGELVILVGNNEQFVRFCSAIEMPELAEDARFAGSAGRVVHGAELNQLIGPKLLLHPVAYWSKILELAGIPYGPINDIAGVFANPQVQFRQAATSVSHEYLGEIPIVANPIKMSVTPPSYERPPPMLGEHTASVIERLLGLSQEEIKNFKSKKII